MLADEVLDEAEGAAGGRVVGVNEPSRPERPDIGAPSPSTELRIVAMSRWAASSFIRPGCPDERGDVTFPHADQP